MRYLILLFTLTFSINANAFLLFGKSSEPEIECNNTEESSILDKLSLNNANSICHVYFGDSINEPVSYRNLDKELKNLTEKDVIYLHVVGDGGRGDGLVYILNVLDEVKAKKITIMEGNVASAHALLVMAGDEIQVKKRGLILFHNISISNMGLDICSMQVGKDRGLAKYEKCMENLPKYEKFYNDIVRVYVKKVLNKIEMLEYEAGHDIILDSNELKKRLGIEDADRD